MKFCMKYLETDGFLWPVNLYFFNGPTIAQNHKGNCIELHRNPCLKKKCKSRQEKIQPRVMPSCQDGIELMHVHFSLEDSYPCV